MKKNFIKRMSQFMAIAMLASCFSMLAVPQKSNAAELVGAGDIIRNNTFNNGVGLPWHIVESYPAAADFTIEDGKYSVTIKNKGTERWDVQFRHRGLTIERGHTYNIKFTVSSTKDCKIYPKIGDQGEQIGRAHV